jgi:diadenosine tetraphosphate (Ap4A) HIT family hydrolase
MPEGMVDIIELPFSWLSAEPRECIKGACHLTFKHHKIELYELNDEEALGFMRDIQKCAKALKNATNAIKVNYEIHGNTIPHLHVHLYPRYLDDPYPDQPINYKNKSNRINDDGEFEFFIKEMKKELKH